jgi:hypothetical protein
VPLPVHHQDQRPDVVEHGVDEVALPGQHRVGPAALGDVEGDDHPTLDRAVLVAQRRRRDLEGAAARGQLEGRRLAAQGRPVHRAEDVQHLGAHDLMEPAALDLVGAHALVGQGGTVGEQEPEVVVVQEHRRAGQVVDQGAVQPGPLAGGLLGLLAGGDVVHLGQEHHRLARVAADELEADLGPDAAAVGPPVPGLALDHRHPVGEQVLDLGAGPGQVGLVLQLGELETFQLGLGAAQQLARGGVRPGHATVGPEQHHPGDADVERRPELRVHGAQRGLGGCVDRACVRVVHELGFLRPGGGPLNRSASRALA